MVVKTPDLQSAADGDSAPLWRLFALREVMWRWSISIHDDIWGVFSECRSPQLTSVRVTCHGSGYFWVLNVLPAEFIFLSKLTLCLLAKIFVSLQPTGGRWHEKEVNSVVAFFQKETAPRLLFVFTRWIHFSMCRLISAFKNTVPTTYSGMCDPE